MAGNKLALSTQVQYPRQTVNDVDAVIAPTTSSVAVTVLTGPRTLTLPVVTSYPVGLPLIISDESGSCSATNSITIRNAANTANITKLTRPSQSVVLRNTGGGWVLMDLTNEVLVRLLQTGPLAEALALKPSTINGKSAVDGAIKLTGDDIELGASDTTKISTLITRLSTNLSGLAVDTLDAIDQLNNTTLNKNNNLSELSDKSAARTNLQIGSFYAALTGATYTGNVSVRGASSQGYVNVSVSGQNTHTGYIEFIRSDNTRIGYIGYGDANTLNIASDTDIPWNFNVPPKVAGNTVWHPGNFNPANYAPLSGSTFTGNVFISFNSDAVLTLEDTSAPTNTFRRKQIYSSKNVSGGNDWLFRQRRPSDGAIEDFHFKSGQGGTVWTTGNFNPFNYASLSGAIFSGDITTYRANAPSTGVIYLGSNSSPRYLYYDGANYVMPNADLYVNGQKVWTAGTFNPANYANLSTENTFTQRQFAKLGSNSLINQDDIKSRIEGGFYWTNGATLAKGWPVNGDFYHLITATYPTNEYYSLQIAGGFFDNSDFYIRKTQGSTPSTAPWNKLVHSGNLRETVADGSYYVIRFPDGTMLQGATSVVQLDANGRRTIPLITTGVTGCAPVVSNGDVNVNGSWAGSYSQNESGFGVYFPNSANATVRINWYAYSRWK